VASTPETDDDIMVDAIRRRSRKPLLEPVLAADDGDEGGGDGDGKTGVALKAKPKTKKPSLYKVLMLNDDYTPMEFVVYVLQRFFNMDHGRAVDIMLTVHNKGVAVVGVYPFEIAETKVTQVMDCARSNQHPLQCTMEKE
jgi:ATP-dependent Clp protease adaptor protein ClpS